MPRLLLEELETRNMLSVNPIAVINTPASPASVFIGDQQSVAVSFTNPSPGATEVGYSPYLVVYMPTAGIGSNNDGVTLDSATYLGTPITATPYVLNASGQGTATLAPDGATVALSGRPGDTAEVFQLPFGSFRPDQPQATIDLTTTVNSKALLGQNLPITAQAIFAQGNSPTGTSAVVQSTASEPTLDINPTIIKLQKIYEGPEQETATGPNFHQPYELVVTVAKGQTVTNLDVSDVMPSDMQFVAYGTPSQPSITSVNNSAYEIKSTPPVYVAGTDYTPGGKIDVNFDSITGTGGNDADAVVPFTFYVPENNSTDSPVLDLTTGNFQPMTNTANTSGSYTAGPGTPNPAGNPANTGTPTATANDTVTDKSIAIQKGVTDITHPAAGSNPADVQPGDILKYTLNFQVSDFFAFQNVLAQDLISDGQLIYDPSSTYDPTLAYSQHGTSLSGSFGQFNVSSLASNSTQDPVTGVTQADFNVSALVSQLGNTTGGKLLGASVPDSGTGGSTPDVIPGTTTSVDPAIPGTVGTITFYTQVQTHYTGTNQQLPAGSTPSIAPVPVVQGDNLTDTVTIGQTSGNTSYASSIPGTDSGAVLSYADATTETGHNQTDNSQASVSLQRGQLTKTVYAINGVLSTDPAFPKTAGGLPLVQPGDNVTYELTYTLPHSDIANYSLSDFLPQPIFVDPASLTQSASAVNDPGTWSYGPNDTFHSLPNAPTPSVTLLPASNGLEFNYGNYSNSEQTTSGATPFGNGAASESDLLFTVTATDAQFSDGLFLTNQGSEDEGSVTGGTQHLDAIAMVQVEEPKLAITKGIVSTNDAGAKFSESPSAPSGVTFAAPGTPGFTGTITSSELASTPIQSNLSNAQPGDYVKFAAVVNNTGTSPGGAFDVTISDTIPTGFHIPAGGLDFTVTDGSGHAINYHGATPATASDVDDPADFFNGGIVLDDASSTLGSLTSVTAGASNGSNVAVVTYDLQVDGDNSADVVDVGTLKNTAELTNYASLPGGPDFLNSPLTDTRDVSLNPTVGKVAVTEFQTLPNSDPNSPTNNPNVGSAQAVIGELVTYTVTVTVPKGYSAIKNAIVVDTLDSGLAFVSGSAAVYSSGVSATNGTVTPTSTDGQHIDYNFGEIDNNNPAAGGTITLTYEAIVLNVSSNQTNTQLKNSAALSYTDSGTGGTDTTPAGTTTTTVVQPKVTLNKSVTVPSGGAQAGSPITYTLTLTHDSTTPNAYDVVVNDPLPTLGGASLIVSPTFNVVDTAGLLTNADFSLTGSNATGWTLTTPSSFEMTNIAGRTVTITITGTLSQSETPKEYINNTATASFDDLGRSPSATAPSNVADSTDRTSDLSHSANFTTLGATGLTKKVDPTSLSVSGVTQPASGAPNLVNNESVTFDVTFTLSAATYSSGLVLTDTLPSGSTTGMTYVSSSLVSVGSSITGNTSPSGTSSGSAVTFNFGSGVVVAPNGTTSSDQITVAITALVNPADINGLLTNNAKLQFDGNASDDLTASAQVNVVSPTLDITKSANKSPVDAGDVVTYTAVVSVPANSSAPAFNLKISDPIPTGATLVAGSVTSTAGTIVTGNGPSDTSILVTDPELLQGGSFTITYQVTITEAVPAGSTITNTITAKDDFGPTPAGATEPRTGSTPASANVVVNTNSISGYMYADTSKAGDYSSLAPVGNVTITLTGTDDLGNPVSIPVTTNPTTGAYDIPNLRPGTYTLTETMPSGYLPGKDAAGTPFGGSTPPGSTTVLQSIVIPPEMSQNGINYDFYVKTAADLGVTKTISDPTPQLGEVVTYTVTATNHGPSDGTGVVVTDALPSGLSFVSASGPGTYDATNGLWTIGALANGASDVLTIHAKVVAGTASTNTASINGDQYDQNSSNNTASVTDNPEFATGLTKTVDPSSLSVPGVTQPASGAPNLVNNETVTFDVTFTLSPSTYSHGLTLTDLLPSTATSSMTYVSSSLVSVGSSITGNTSPSGTASGSSVVFNFGSGVVVATGGSTSSDQITVAITARVDGNDVNGLLTNNASLQFDSNPADDLTASAQVNVVSPTLNITKSANKSPVDAGDVVTYTAVVSVPTSSASPAFNLKISDPIPTGAALVAGSVTSTAGTIVTGNGASDTSILVTDPELVQGGSFTITYQVTMTEAVPAGSTVTNTVTAKDDFGPTGPIAPRSGSTDATANVVINTNSISGYMYADISKASDYSSLAPVGNVTITLTGTDDLGNPVSIPVTTNPTTGAYDIPNLRPGTYTLTETMPSGYLPGKDAAGTPFGGTTPTGSTTVIKTIVIPPEMSQNGINYDFYVKVAADLGVTKTIDVPYPQIGQVVTYTVTASDNGPSNATGVVVTDAIPSGLTFVSATPSVGTYDHTTGLWTIGALADGATDTLTIKATVVANTAQTNTATINGNQYDQNSTNNSASATETPEADIALSKTVTSGTTTPQVGYTVTYDVAVVGKGPGTSTNVVVNDPLPAGLLFISATTSGDTTTSYTGGVWTVGTLALGQTDHLDITARVVGLEPSITNTATVTEDQYDGLPNTASATINPVLCVTGLLDQTAGYNAFIFGNATITSSDIDGALAVGGNATISNYSIGNGLPGGNPAQNALVVGGNLNFTNGSVANGNVVYGGTGTFNSFGLGNGYTASQGTVPGLDFTAVMYNELAQSANLGAILPSGTMTNQYGILTLTGTNPSLNVFDISGATLASTNTVIINAPYGSVVAINVSGTSDTWGNMGISISGTDREHVVWNFPQATSLNISGISVQGDVLAPKADVNFNSGNLEGTLVAASLEGTGEFHNYHTKIGCVADINPVAPTGVTAVGGTNQITISWNGDPGATSYEIFRSTTPGGEGATPYATGITTNSFVDTGLAPGATYYYTVVAENRNGPSPASFEVRGIVSLANQNFVANLENDFLGQSTLDATGTALAAQLDAGTITTTQVVNTIITEPAFYSREATVVYTALLGTAPDAATAASYASQLQGGASLESVMANIFASSKFAALVQSTSPPGSDQNADFVSLMGAELLGNASSGFLSYWDYQVQTQGKQAVAAEILSSMEFRENFIDALYAPASAAQGSFVNSGAAPDLLGRSTQPALSETYGLVFGNLNLLALEAAVASSTEYYNKP